MSETWKIKNNVDSSVPDDRWTRPALPGDLVQFDPEKTPSFAACLAQVIKVSEDHRELFLMVSMPNPSLGLSVRVYVQAKRGDVAIVGPSVWLVSKELMELDMEMSDKFAEIMEQRYAEAHAVAPEKRN